MRYTPGSIPPRETNMAHVYLSISMLTHSDQRAIQRESPSARNNLGSGHDQTLSTANGLVGYTDNMPHQARKAGRVELFFGICFLPFNNEKKKERKRKNLETGPFLQQLKIRLDVRLYTTSCVFMNVPVPTTTSSFLYLWMRTVLALTNLAL